MEPMRLLVTDRAAHAPRQATAWLIMTLGINQKMKLKSFIFNCSGYDLARSTVPLPENEKILAEHIDATINDWIGKQMSIRIIDIRHSWSDTGSQRSSSSSNEMACFIAVLYE